MKLTGLITIDKLTPGVEYVQYIDLDTEHLTETFYTERLVGSFWVFIDNKEVLKHLLVAGEYIQSVSKNGKVIHQFISDKKQHYQETINDKSLFQSITDFEKDLKRSDDIQENALSNTMGRAIALKSGNYDITKNILEFVSNAAVETKYPTGKDEYNPITKKEQDAENRLKREKKWKERWNKNLRTNSLGDNNNIVNYKPKYSSSLSNIHDDIISDQTHNKTPKKTSIFNRVRTIFENWQKSRSRSKIHAVKGGKRKTRNNKKTRKTRKSKPQK